MAELNETNNQEPIENEENNNETVNATAAEVENHQETDDKADKIVAKLQKRIGEEQAKKNEYKDQLDDALKRIARLEKGEDPDQSETKDERDERIAALEAQIKRQKITDTARGVLAEGGINVPDAVLGFIVADDDKTTLGNVKSLLTYTQSIRDDARKELLAGKTPKDQTSTAAPSKKLKDMSLAERNELAQQDMSLYEKLKQQL
ncbi:MAG: DUF4355 domain-containing protein [Loigolactobacillus coryniformis]|uniref:capsid assembly scaffolding protein Gp46 family protein n=1 Tax=Loigolactobacillus coryniformis TaxID=1610 RepID=UPI00264A2C69|nr:DUF4355 domain-containing protein [Loigolactobacillus coryniformis]MDN5954041.1 DUF4355 domain-containing protein [Loigolactobacillus coryniformis]